MLVQPCWWPQQILPWEEMKKMGGRKSQELSHINYTEILKQCLAAVGSAKDNVVFLVFFKYITVPTGNCLSRRLESV